MSADVVVRPDGKISLPLLNDMQAAGLTPEQLREAVEKAAAKYSRSRTSPSSSRRSTAGRCSSPGRSSSLVRIPLTGDMTVLQLIAPAGGLQEYADAKNIRVMRTENGKDRSLQVQLQGRDQGKEPGAEHPAEARATRSSFRSHRFRQSCARFGARALKHPAIAITALVMILAAYSPLPRRSLRPRRSRGLASVSRAVWRCTANPDVRHSFDVTTSVLAGRRRQRRARHDGRSERVAIASHRQLLGPVRESGVCVAHPAGSSGRQSGHEHALLRGHGNSSARVEAPPSAWRQRLGQRGRIFAHHKTVIETLQQPTPRAASKARQLVGGTDLGGYARLARARARSAKTASFPLGRPLVCF